MSCPTFMPNGVPKDASNLTTDQFNTMKTYASKAFDTAIDAINALTNMPFMSTIDTAITFDEIPSLDASINTGVPPTAPTITTPAQPSIALEYDEDPYVDSLLDQLKAVILDVLQNGGTGLSSTAEAAEMSLEAERDALVIQDSKDSIGDDWAERGKLLPTPFYLANLRVIDVEYANKQLDKSRQILIRNEDLAIKNKEFMVQQANTIEATLMNYTGGKWERKLRAAIGVVDVADRIYRAALEYARTQSAIYRDEAGVYSEEVRAGVAVVGAKVSEYQAKSGVTIEEKRIELQRIGLLIEQAKDQIALVIQALSTVSNVASHLAAGAMSSASASAHVAFTGSEVETESIGQTYSCSDVHQTYKDETTTT